ncbi:unknown protein [Microcystis aeruginosa NIES-843]|uniref:Uncharacterized protein n=1 Tax=Microcystis aeruginosa (strain NIES-843 / IAM M-2473) TaxID=449447 RepID=B0JVR9_MICAN|nr:unknown protein [Microcystis aeruginosa NIES-843]
MKICSRPAILTEARSTPCRLNDSDHCTYYLTKIAFSELEIICLADLLRVLLLSNHQSKI